MILIHKMYDQTVTSKFGVECADKNKTIISKKQ